MIEWGECVVICVFFISFRSILQQMLLSLTLPNVVGTGMFEKMSCVKNVHVQFLCVWHFYPCSWSIHFICVTHECVCVFSAYSEEDLSDAFSKESCITEQTQYFFENENTSFSGAMDCGNCSRWGLFLCLDAHKSVCIPWMMSSFSHHLNLDILLILVISLRLSLCLLCSLPHSSDQSDVPPAVNPAGRCV